MPPLKYHEGQLSIQREAKTTVVAQKLAGWVGPVAEFALEADLFLLVSDSAGELRFTALSGAPPLLDVEGWIERRHSPASPSQSGVRLRFPRILLPPPPLAVPYGGLAINFANLRRARINGLLVDGGETTDLIAHETFTLCRKYIAPSIPLATSTHSGPESRDRLPLDNPWLVDLLGSAETSFLATVSPVGVPDISHRGGPPGFLRLDVNSSQLSWDEYVGDGVFKGAGNLRATGRLTLLVPEIETGDAVELVGTGWYTNIRGEQKQRLDPLVQHRESYPLQGRIETRIERAYRLGRLLQPRRRPSVRSPVTSASPVFEQAPQ